jgi:hypothetical protein
MNVSIEDANVQFNLVRWRKPLCPKIGTDNIPPNEGLMPLDYAQHSCMYSRTLIIDENFFLKLE